MLRCIPLLFFCLATNYAGAQDLILQENFVHGRTGPGWEVHFSPGNQIGFEDGLARIRARLHTFAHLSRHIDTDNIAVQAKIKPSSPEGISWCTSIFLFWNNANWCQAGMISDPSGVNRFYAAETLDGFTFETYLEPTEFSKAHWVRIELGSDALRYCFSDDGRSWKCLRVTKRPNQFVGPPVNLIVGKGFSNDKPEYSKPDLDNDYTDPGPWAVSEVSEIKVETLPSSRRTLSTIEQREMFEAGLDPVGKIELQGKADPIYEKVANYYPPMKYPKEAVGVPEHPIDICIDHLGRLQLNYNEPPVAWIEVNGKPIADEAHPWKRQVDENGPIIYLTCQRDGLLYKQLIFGWSEDFSPDGPLYAYLRLIVQHVPGTPQVDMPRKIALAYGAEGNHKVFPLAVAMYAGIPSGVVSLKMPFPHPDRTTAISYAAMEQTYNQTIDFWKKITKNAEIFHCPLTHAYKVWINYAMLNVDIVNGYPEPHDGTGFYEEIYGYSAALHCIALDMYGMHDRAERYLDTLIHFQQPDGLYTQNFGLPDQGCFLLALSEHYKFTGQKDWLRRVAPHIVKAGDWLIRKRAEAPKEGITKGLIKFRPYCDYPEPEVNYFADAYCCVGLERAAQVLAEIGMTEEAERFSKEAKTYRQDILASMDKSAITLGAQTVLPLVPETHRLLKSSGYTAGDYYGLVASCLLESEFLPPYDKRSRWITDFLEHKNGLIAGVCKFQTGGIDHAYTYGYLLTELKRGNPRKVILGLYGMLAYGMTRDTYSGVECTSVVTGTNMWTLPHLYSATQQLRTLRMMFIREDGNDLRIGEAIPRKWLEDGQSVEAKNAPTHFGNLSFRINSMADEGKIELNIIPPTRKPPARILITLRHPDMLPIKALIINGRKSTSFGNEVIQLEGLKRPAKIIALYK